MLFKNDVKPALAYAGAAGENTWTNAKKDVFTAMSADGDDFGNFSASASAKDTKQNNRSQPRKNNKGNKKFPIKGLLIAIGVIAAVILLIAIIVAVFNTPKSGTKISDNAYFYYVDSDNKYHVVVNGDEIKETFDNEIEIFPAANNSFAYILETVEEDERGNSGMKMHILEGKKLKSSDMLIDEYVQFARCKPGIIYKYNNSYGIFKGDTEDIITEEKSANNFIISDDAKTIVYTLESSKKKGLNILYCFQGLIEEDIYEGMTPVAISPDGRYVYGTIDSSETGILCYLDLEKKEIVRKDITNKSYGEFHGITEMNAEGTEIIFYSTIKDKTTLEEKIVSFFYQIGDKSPTLLSQGIFTLADYDPTKLAPSTFKDAYFVAQKAIIEVEEEIEDEDEEDEEDTTHTTVVETEGVITYRFKKNGNKNVTELAKAEGKFSPDGKYFYFIKNSDGKTSLARIALSASDYEEATVAFQNKPLNFALTQKGDIYVLNESGSETTANLIFIPSSNLEAKQRITSNADKESLRACGNTVYFTETIGNDEDAATTVYTSTDGSDKVKADFAGKELSESPYIITGSGRNAYAFSLDEDGAMMLFFTSNGKSFELVSDSCTFPGFESSESDKKPAKDDDEDEKADDNKNKNNKDDSDDDSL